MADKVVRQAQREFSATPNKETAEALVKAKVRSGDIEGVETVYLVQNKDGQYLTQAVTRYLYEPPSTGATEAAYRPRRNNVGTQGYHLILTFKSKLKQAKQFTTKTAIEKLLIREPEKARIVNKAALLKQLDECSILEMKCALLQADAQPFSSLVEAVERETLAKERTAAQSALEKAEKRLKELEKKAAKFDPPAGPNA